MVAERVIPHREEVERATHAEYDKLQQGDEGSLAKIVQENPMRQYAVSRQIETGSGILAAVHIDQNTGRLSDARLVMPIDSAVRPNYAVFEQLEALPVAIKWETIPADQFDTLPNPKPTPKTDPEWEEIVTALESGQVVKIPYADEKELRGKRLSVGHRAIKRGFRVELRYGNGFIAARKSGHVVTDGLPAAEEPIRSSPRPNRPAGGARSKPQKQRHEDAQKGGSES